MWEIRTSNAKIFTFPAFNFDILTSKSEVQSKIIYYFSSPTSTPQQQYNEVFSTGFYAILMVLPIRVKKIPKFIGDCSCLGRSVAAVALKPWKVFFTYGFHDGVCLLMPWWFFGPVFESKDHPKCQASSYKMKRA